MSLFIALYTVENNKTKKSVKFRGDMLFFCDFIQVYVFTTNHHLKPPVIYYWPFQGGSPVVIFTVMLVYIFGMLAMWPPL